MIRIVFLFAIVFFTAGCSVTEVAEIIYDSVKEHEDRDESDKQRRDDGHAEKPLIGTSENDSNEQLEQRAKTIREDRGPSSEAP
jgi:hypothetical protein